MQIPHRAFVRIAGIGAPHPRRIGLHGLELLDDGVRVLAQSDGVAVGLGHLAPVETRDLRRRGQQHLRLGQDGDAGAFEKSEQAVAVGDREARIRLDQRARLGERVGIALFLEFLAQRCGTWSNCAIPGS